MKTIQYKFLSYEVNRGTQENPDMEQVLLEKTLFCKNQGEFDECYPVAEKEAVGQITVDGAFDPEEPTDAERIAELEEALDMLLSGVTE